MRVIHPLLLPLQLLLPPPRSPWPQDGSSGQGLGRRRPRPPDEGPWSETGGDPNGSPSSTSQPPLPLLPLIPVVIPFEDKLPLESIVTADLESLITKDNQQLPYMAEWYGIKEGREIGRVER